MTLKLKNKVALITGASAGIGKAIAETFAREGANLFLCAREIKRLKEVASELKKYKVRVETCSADVSNMEAIDNVYKQFIGTYEKLDILVNNAGMHKPSKFLDYSYEDFDQVMKVNLYSVVFVTQKMVPLMIKRAEGKVINISSTGGKWGTKNQCAYNTSKHAVNGFTKCLALDLAEYNINVNAICPWRVNSKLSDTSLIKHAEIRGIGVDQLTQEYLMKSPMKKFLNPEDVAHLALYLASEESHMMTGQALTISGGYLLI